MDLLVKTCSSSFFDPVLAAELKAVGDGRLIITYSGLAPRSADHPVGAYRRIAETLRRESIRAPLWIRNTTGNPSTP